MGLQCLLLLMTSGRLLGLRPGLLASHGCNHLVLLLLLLLLLHHLLLDLAERLVHHRLGVLLLLLRLGLLRLLLGHVLLVRGLLSSHAALFGKYLLLRCLSCHLLLLVQAEGVVARARLLWLRLLLGVLLLAELGVLLLGLSGGRSCEQALV